jgi:2-dehydropantoate 2-reductase
MKSGKRWWRRLNENPVFGKTGFRSEAWVMTDSLLIVGTGALACLFAARLTAAGARVTMLGTWAEGLASLRSHGVRVVEADGSERAYPVRATADPAECAGARFALVLVKSWQAERAARQLVACLSPDGLALTLQNGLGNREKLAQALGAPRVALGVTTSGATLVGPGQVRPGGEGSVSLGAHPRLDPLADLLQRAGFAVEIVPEAEDLLWSKLVINAAINPLTALLCVPNGELLARPPARTLMAATAREAATVAAALGRQLTYPDPVATAEAVAQRTAVNRSSMLQDVLRGAPTEIDAICGAIVAAGEGCGVPTPLNRTLWLLVKALEQKGE